MSCHFHMLRKRRAAEAARKAAEEARQAAAVPHDKEEVDAEPEAAPKAARGRRKGDA